MMAAFIALVTIVNAGKLHHHKEFYKTLTSDTIPSAKKNRIISPDSSIKKSNKLKDTIPVPKKNNINSKVFTPIIEFSLDLCYQQ